MKFKLLVLVLVSSCIFLLGVGCGYIKETEEERVPNNMMIEENKNTTQIFEHDDEEIKNMVEKEFDKHDGLEVENIDIIEDGFSLDLGGQTETSKDKKATEIDLVYLNVAMENGYNALIKYVIPNKTFKAGMITTDSSEGYLKGYHEGDLVSAEMNEPMNEEYFDRLKDMIYE